MKKILLNRQLKKVTLKFWNNMIILSVLMLLLVGSVSAADTALFDQKSIGNTNDALYNDVQASLTKESAVKAYNAMSLMEPKVLIKSVNPLSLVSNIDLQTPYLLVFSAVTQRSMILPVYYKIMAEKYNQINLMSIKTKHVGEEPFDNYNMIGKWGYYDSFEDGEFIALRTDTEIFGRVSTEEGNQYFYLFIRPFLKTFHGVILIDDEFHSISGKYMTDENRYTAMWEIEKIKGWFIGISP